MAGELEELTAKFAALEREAANMRLGSIAIGRRYAEAQESLKELTALTLAAAIQGAAAVDKAVLASTMATSAAKALVSGVAFDAADAAAATTTAAAAAAVEAAAAATKAAKAAVLAAAHEPEKTALASATEATEKAAAGARRAVDCAAEAVTLAHAAAELVKTSKK